MSEKQFTEGEKALLRLIASSSIQDRLNHLRSAFNHIIEGRNACRDLRHSLSPDLRERYGIKLVAIETLCSFALIDADRAGVKGLKEPIGDPNES